jgi:hypothetical protein
MDARGIGAVALRVIGLVLLVGVISSIPVVVMGFTVESYAPEHEGFMRASQMGSLLSLLVSTALGVSLLLWAEPLARFALPESATLSIGVDERQLLSVGLALIGALILVHGIEGVASLGYLLLGKPKGIDMGNTEYLWERESEAMVRACVKIVLGVVLLLGRTGLARTWAQIRSIARTGHGLTRP